MQNGKQAVEEGLFAEEITADYFIVPFWAACSHDCQS